MPRTAPLQGPLANLDSYEMLEARVSADCAADRTATRQRDRESATYESACRDDGAITADYGTTLGTTGRSGTGLDVPEEHAEIQVCSLDFTVLYFEVGLLISTVAS